MPDFIYHCPHCGQKMQCDSEQFDGMTVATCPQCHQEICPSESNTITEPEIIKLPPRNTKPEPPPKQEQSNQEPAHADQPQHDKKPLTLEEKLKREHNNYENYSYPWLCFIFNVAGIFNVIGCVILISFIFHAVDKKMDFMPFVTLLVFCIIAAIFDFGISKLIAFIGETAYNTKIMRIIAEHQSTSHNERS